MKKHIQEFIDFNYKEASFLDYFIGFFVLGFFTFLIVPTNTEKPAVTYFAFFIDAAYIVVIIIGRKLFHGKERTFFCIAMKNRFMSVILCLFAAGLTNHTLLVFLLSFILSLLLNGLMVVFACRNIRKRAFSKEKLKGKGKISIPLIMFFSISGVLVGRILFSLIDVPNGFMLGLMLFIGAMLGGGNYLLKIYLLRWDKKKITNKFIDYLNDVDE